MKIDSSNTEKQKSLAIAVLVYGVLLLLLFFIRFWPPSNLEELVGGGGGGGMTVNFGDTDFGKGDDFTSKELNVQQATQPIEKPAPEEDILSQENSNDDVISVPKNEPKKQTPVVTKPEKKVETETKPVVKKTDDALANILKGNKKGGDGTSSKSGNQGKSGGDINSNGYLGTGGSGGGKGGGNGNGNGIGSGDGSGSGSGGGNGSGNGKGTGAGYALSGRIAISKPRPVYNCNEEGTVVVQITVDKNGTVTDAKPGARGTTNSANCLSSQAKIAALNTKWNASPDGTEKQVGTITYNFTIRN
ncbi:MAG: energy transducer TonB [Flavobacterium sp.]|jgi:TonB family protein|nr:energy transducer TonB [Flavobacterium sp.]